MISPRSSGLELPVKEAGKPLASPGGAGRQTVDQGIEWRSRIKETVTLIQSRED
jgi:hypothetical protein